MTDSITIFEVGPRDGLQNEARHIATADKITLVDELALCGLRKIEAASFVSPKWVPQMADGAAVMAGISRLPGVTYAALTPNLHGFASALAARADMVAVFASASEGFSRANINCTVAESLARFAAVTDAARLAGVPVRGYVSCVCDCPFDGPTAPEAVADVAARLMAMGCVEVSLGDTLGRAGGPAVVAMLDTVLERCPAGRLAGHFHDTGGRAVENIRISMARGLRVFDASVGGLGGCPYAPGAKGNVATESVVAMAEAEGFDTGVDSGRLAHVARLALGFKGAA
jgi:hydroxymethylglutaryl-CoA lyase